MTPTRIFHVLGTALVGGTERQLLMLLDHLDPQRFHNGVALIRGGPLEGEFARRVPTTVIGKRGSVDVAFFVRLAIAMRRFRPHIVQTWGPTANVWGPLAAFIAGAPNVIMCDRELDLWKGRVRGTVDSVLARRAKVVVGNARAVVAASVARGVPPEKVTVIYNGVDVPRARVPPPRAGRILMLGRIDPRKGHDILVEALPAVAASVPEVQVMIAGSAVLDHELLFERDLRRRVDELGLSERMTYAGTVSEPGVFIDAADVVVVPSRAEGTPNVVLEAMAHGRVVVGAAVGGIPEALSHGTSGFLVPPDDPPALAGALITALSCEPLAEKLGIAARAVATDRFSPSKMATEWSRLYQGLGR